MRYQSQILMLAAGILLAACSDSDGSLFIPQPTDILQTGIYKGTLESNGDVALVRLYLARNGLTRIVLETDDSERATDLLAGQTDNDLNYVDDSLGVDISFSESETGLTINVDYGDLQGTALLSLSEESQRTSSLELISGQYVYVINGITTQLIITDDGSVSLEGICSGTGEINVIDDAVNLYAVELSSGSCKPFSGVANLSTIETATDVLHIVAEKLFDQDLFRID